MFNSSSHISCTWSKQDTYSPSFTWYVTTLTIIDTFDGEQRSDLWPVRSYVAPYTQLSLRHHRVCAPVSLETSGLCQWSFFRWQVTTTAGWEHPTRPAVFVDTPNWAFCELKVTSFSFLFFCSFVLFPVFLLYTLVLSERRRARFWLLAVLHTFAWSYRFPQ